MKQLLPALLVLTLLAGCKKDDPEADLPPPTHAGLNTGGCLIDGKRFVAKTYGGNLLSSPIQGVNGGFYFDSLYYLTLNGGPGEGTVSLFLRRPSPRTYLLNQTTLYYPQGDPLYLLDHAMVTYPGGRGEVYVTDAQHPGSVTLTHADIRTLISAGTFEFTAVSTFDPSKTVRVTKGRFDSKQ
ncbi:hypothetical protein GCM10023185_10330 [Hymenobacter saemangeumensis]|uniref:Uncharacterized protein n=1 Tax=Hymenobacter saemangeumensis TaxID=1084522 RepID=A0ABP8I528_9BACT